jgi:hypothetical protein
MAKFRLTSATVFTIAAQAVPCPTSISLDETMDDYISDCAANAVKEHVLGAKAVSGSFSGETEHNGATALGYVAPGVTGALILQPAGNTAGNITITSSAFKITSRSLGMSATGLTTYTCNFVMDNITVGTI